MKISFFDTHKYEKSVFDQALKEQTIATKTLTTELTTASIATPTALTIQYFEERLNEQTAKLVTHSDIICCFVNDRVNKQTLQVLSQAGVKLIALRCAGFNNVDLQAAEEYKIKVVRVPEYSPHAVAEHALALIMTLNRKTHRAYNRVREGNFSIEGLTGFDLHKKTAGIVGTGKIGKVMCQIMKGLGCQVLAFDVTPDHEFAKQAGIQYKPFDELIKSSDVISLHVPLNPATHHLINESTFNNMKAGAMLINTGRGALINTKALIEALKSGHLGAAGLDVYEEEEGVFFHDLSDKVLQDDLLARLLTFHNVVITSHQAFLTTEALRNIADTTITNILSFAQGRLCNEVSAATHVRKS